MQLFDSTQYGIDLLVEISIGWYFSNILSEYGYDIVYRPDGTTPVNFVSGFAWIDDLETKRVVRKQDYTDYRTQMVLPIISYDIVSDTAESIELGTNSKRKIYTLSFVIAAENKAQNINLCDFITSVLEKNPIPIINYNVNNNALIGVITCEDVISTRLYNVFVETDLSKKFSIEVTCDAVAEYDNTFTLR